jgi:hypothetical protein
MTAERGSASDPLQKKIQKSKPEPDRTRVPVKEKGDEGTEKKQHISRKRRNYESN